MDARSREARGGRLALAHARLFGCLRPLTVARYTRAGAIREGRRGRYELPLFPARALPPGAQSTSVKCGRDCRCPNQKELTNE